MEKLYKVLVDGKSCHNGSLEWSLPKEGKPGEWHEVSGELQLCYHGLHLTDDPAQWWKPECKVYLVEAEGVVGTCAEREDRKVVARRVRLIRELDAAELEALRIYTSGKHEVKEGRHVASGSASVEASGSASVVAYGSASVVAYGSATVVTWRGNPSVNLLPKSKAVHIERGDESEAPKIHVAEE